MLKIKKRRIRQPAGKKANSERYFSRLSEAQLAQFEAMLTRGGIYTDIIKVIKQEWKLFLDTSDRTLEDKIGRYNTHVMKPKLEYMTDSEKRQQLHAEVVKLEEVVDVNKDLVRLACIQKRRVERITGIENLMMVPGSTTVPTSITDEARKEIKVLADVLEKLAKVQLETGVIKRAPKFISGEIQRSDENDPLKLTFQLTENFIDTLNSIEGEYSKVLDAETSS